MRRAIPALSRHHHDLRSATFVDARTTWNNYEFRQEVESVEGFSSGPGRNKLPAVARRELEMI